MAQPTIDIFFLCLLFALFCCLLFFPKRKQKTRKTKEKKTNDKKITFEERKITHTNKKKRKLWISFFKCLAACSGSSAEIIAETTAIPLTPHFMISFALLKLTPPIATVGCVEILQASLFVLRTFYFFVSFFHLVCLHKRIQKNHTCTNTKKKG